MIIALYEIRSGRIKIPPQIGVGPIKIDASALIKPSERAAGATADLSDVAPVVDSGGSIAAGCLTLISAGMVLVGFIMPWFTCNIANIIQGSFSGVTQMITMIVTLLTTVLGSLTAGSPGEQAASSVLAILFLVAILFLGTVPLAGLYIGSLGLRLMRSLRESGEERGKLSRLLVKAGLVGLVPVCCYMTSASAIPTLDVPQLFSGLPSIGVQSAGAGVWVTLAGFVVAIAAGFIISVTVSLAEQLRHPPSSVD